MALARPVAEWPLLLCGPVLRRVTRSSVAVFVALSRSARVTLEVYEGTMAGVPGTLRGSVGRDPVRLGDRLFVAVVELGLSVLPGRTYGYDVRLTGTDGTERRLANLGLVAAPYSLGYDAPLPTFSVPGGLADLTLLHGSCRKPHAAGTDAFALVDRILTADRAPTSRPHQLLLTGDQIYADDVAVSLLAMIRATVPLLFGENYAETVAVAGGQPLGFDSPRVTPGPARRALINDTAGLSAGLDAPNLVDAHLLFRAEFLAMYLFAWSDALWPPGAIFPGQQPDLPTGAEVVAFLGAEDLPTFYDAEVDRTRAALRTFARSIVDVRRAMANVPILMLIDDHEVTDDWNINRRWSMAARSNPTARAVIRNALAAYAVFQDWGNRPELYSASGVPRPLGRRILDALSPAPGPGADAADLDDVFDLNSAATPASRRMRWDWVLADTAAGYQVVALDTRTWRSFPPGGPRAAAGLIAGDPALSDTQIATPGGPPLGFQLTARLPVDGRLTVVLSPTPVLGHPVVELSVRGLGATSRNPSWPEQFDDESWAANRVAFEEMIRRLGSFGSVLVLSGDVHYSFSAEASYFDTPAIGPGRASRIVQLCSSALHNQDDMTLSLGRAGFGELTELGWLGFAGNRTADRGAVLAGLQLAAGLPGQLPAIMQERFDAPAVLPDRHYNPAALGVMRRLTGDATGSTGRTDWRYLIRYLGDTRDPRAMLTDAGLPPDLLDRVPALRDTLLAARVVGTNNVGRVRLRTTPAGAVSAVIHELWWWLGTPDAARPVVPITTRHEASLAAPTAADRTEPRP